MHQKYLEVLQTLVSLIFPDTPDYYSVTLDPRNADSDLRFTLATGNGPLVAGATFGQVLTIMARLHTDHTV